jgi:hypothetical protein
MSLSWKDRNPVSGALSFRAQHGEGSMQMIQHTWLRCQEKRMVAQVKTSFPLTLKEKHTTSSLKTI